MGLIWLSIAEILSCILTASFSNSNITVVLIMAAFFGFTIFPIYSVATAHAHDFASPGERVELSATMLFFFALSVIAAPFFIASQLLSSFGPAALFILIALGHVALVVFGLNRIRVRPKTTEKTPYICPAHHIHYWPFIRQQQRAQQLCAL